MDDEAKGVAESLKTAVELMDSLEMQPGERTLCLLYAAIIETHKDVHGSGIGDPYHVYGRMSKYLNESMNDYVNEMKNQIDQERQ